MVDIQMVMTAEKGTQLGHDSYACQGSSFVGDLPPFSCSNSSEKEWQWLDKDLT